MLLYQVRFNEKNTEQKKRDNRSEFASVLVF